MGEHGSVSDVGASSDCQRVHSPVLQREQEERRNLLVHLLRLRRHRALGSREGPLLVGHRRCPRIAYVSVNMTSLTRTVI